MNKRIVELAIEAGANFIHDPDRPNDEPLLRLKHLGIEKFAELVVKECLAKIANEAMQYAEPVWAFEIVNDIKEHFELKNE